MRRELRSSRDDELQYKQAMALSRTCATRRVTPSIWRRRGRIAGAVYGGRCERRWGGAPLLLPRVLTRLRERRCPGWGMLPADPMPDLGCSTAAARDLLVDEAANADDGAVEFHGEK